MPNIGYWDSDLDVVSRYLVIQSDGNYAVYINISCLSMFAESVIQIGAGNLALTLTVPDTG